MLLTEEKEAEVKDWVMKRLEDMYVTFALPPSHSARRTGRLLFSALSFLSAAGEHGYELANMINVLQFRCGDRRSD